MGTAGEDSGMGGCQPKGLRDIFKAVVQAVMLFGSETWVLTSRMGLSLGSLQHGVARWIMGIQTKRREEGGREYPPLATEIKEAGFKYIGDYILKRQNTVAQ